MIFHSDVPCNVVKAIGILEYLSARFTYLEKTQWANRVDEGKISINGKCCQKGDTVKANDRISYDAGEFEEPPADLNYTIVYEDQWIIGVDKPGNLLVHRAGKSFRNNLLFQLQNVHEPKFPYAHAIHRLDRETSGITLIAKDSNSISAFTNLFKQNRIEKTYKAIVKGRIDRELKIIDEPLARDRNSEIRYKVAVHKNGKSATTEIVALDYIGKNATLVSLKPLSGRTHQIRVHLAHYGHPILGDKLYGISEKLHLRWRSDPQKYNSDFIIQRQALHCESVRFEHPFTGEIEEIKAGIPNDMEELMGKLRGENC
ncbi:RluA family pseudouridine synthase [Chitinispirillales bacterium ANBcel5]|uniref:RluA family pseudouridine synthase n=1 Tax=Cellulosispirillum alkaliphilum TaxID=3039283 RepID=UPI002A534EEA|nr:RluA family pseudouridine synthase [Chitinispirillales bacterium ANBcel5]